MLEKIKLIIWDLDETLWKGTLSEENVLLSDETRDFINRTLDAGIIHSICSKNDFSTAQLALEKLGIWDCFVFPSIDWSPKGQRIKTIVESIQLRPENILFLDDNHQNRQEAIYYCKGIHAPDINNLQQLFEEGKKLTAKDPNHKRLTQYRILEKKSIEKSNFSTNEDFLFSCHIKLTIHKDCLENAVRLHDLVMRSNQLNYTKLRPSYDEFVELLKDNSIEKGYVRVTDDYGDYGIIGFYAVKNNKCIHFLFSCRTLGMQIEQYVWNELGNPKLEIIGDVVAKLDEKAPSPLWINSKEERSINIVEKEFEQKSRILIIGPCDMDQMFTFLQNGQDIVTEFVYIGTKAPRVENHTHIAQLATALTASESRKLEICSDSDWFDPMMLQTSLGKKNYDTVIISTLPISNGGVYRRIQTGELISFGENYYDFTDEKIYDDAINGRIFTNHVTMTHEQLLDFKTKYEKVDFLQEKSICACLDVIRKACGKAELILILGTEKEYLKENDNAYIGRHLIHKKVNIIIRKWALGKNKVDLLCFDSYIHSQEDFTNRINHYVKRVYFDLAQDIVKIIRKNGNDDIKAVTKISFFLNRLKEKPIVSRWINRINRRIIIPIKKCLK